MDQRKQQITDLCEAFSWLPIHSKNPYMLSFVKEETNQRLNVYFTRMTVTLDDEERRQHHHRNVTLEQLELMLSQ